MDFRKQSTLLAPVWIWNPLALLPSPVWQNIEWMSCHISALCITLPCPVRGLVETTFGGEEFMEGCDSTLPPLRSTHNTSARPSLHPAVAVGWLWGEHLQTSLPHFLTKKEEFSTYRSSGLCWRGAYLVTYFQVGVWPRGQNKISDPKTVYLLQVQEQSVTVPTHLGKAAHPSYLS